MDKSGPEVEFLDPEGRREETDWPQEERIEARRDPRPSPLADLRRPAAFVLVLGLCLGAAAAAGVGAYRRDVAEERAAGRLVLREAVDDPVNLPDAASLGRPGTWREDPSTKVEVDLVNLSPDTVTLLPGAALRGPGVTAGQLAPDGSGRVKPGQVGRLAGTVTVDCGLIPAARSQASAQTTLLVRARLADGSVGAAPIGLNADGESVREQVCLHQGEGVVAGFFPESADPARHTFTVALTARSLAAEPLNYMLMYQYTDGMDAQDLGTTPATSATGRLSTWISILQGDREVTLGAPAPVGSVTGVLQPGASLSGGFAVPVTRCPDAPLEEDVDVDVDLQLIVDDAGRPVLLRADSFDLSTLIEAACGRSR